MKKKVYEKPTIMAMAILPTQMIASSGGGNGSGPSKVAWRICETEDEDLDDWYKDDDEEDNN